jgi:hypothetical protein
MAKTNLAIAAPTVHSMVRGNVIKDIAKQNKKGLTGKLVNDKFVPVLEWLKTSDLIPLESQRETNSKWVVERQEALNGLDMIAFGALSIAHDPDDGNYYVWDGCGRWAIADFNGGIDTVPCLVYNMTKARAAYYFAYTQEEGRRKLSREVTFVNGVIGGDEEHLEWAKRLDAIGAYVKANDGPNGIVNKDAKEHGYPEILARALTDGYKLSGNDITICRQARDMIMSAWGITNTGCPKIVTEVYWALIVVLKAIPESRKNGLHSAMQSYLNYVAQGNSQAEASKEWKGKDLKSITGNVGVAKELGYAFAKSFVGKKNFFKESYRNDFVLGKIIPKKDEGGNE